MSIEAVIESPKGLVIAPAGCGKTQLIVEALSYATARPKLVLTHTTAGVAALRQRLRGLKIPAAHYRISTIAGWALNISGMFPSTCAYSSDGNSQPNYIDLQKKVSLLIQNGHISDILHSSYSRILIDEYQDCSESQHNLICSLSNILPTIIFGDPLQAIFGFSKRDPLPNWNGQVEKEFPVISTLNTPWRWINAGNKPLGDWILEVRRAFLAGESIDLNSVPNCVHHYPLSGDPISNRKLQISTHYQVRKNMLPSESLLVIGDSKRASARHDFAKSTQGIDVVEPVDLKDIVAAADSFDQLHAYELLNQVLTIASNFMSGIDKSGILKRVETIIGNKNRKEPTNIELQAVQLVSNGSPKDILKIINLLEESDSVKIYRSAALAALKDTLALSISQPDKTLSDSASSIREKRRQQGDKRITSRAIGSTLLLKGLESDHVLILDASQMDRSNLYVALSRGSKTITLFS